LLKIHFSKCSDSIFIPSCNLSLQLYTSLQNLKYLFFFITSRFYSFLTYFNKISSVVITCQARFRLHYKYTLMRVFFPGTFNLIYTNSFLIGGFKFSHKSVYINIYSVLELGQRHGISHIPFNNRNTIEFSTDHPCLNHRCQGCEGRDVDIPENNMKTIEFVTSAVFKPSKYPYSLVFINYII